MPAGGCTGSYTLNVAGADLSFVLDAGNAWSFGVAPAVCARFTAMAGASLNVDSKATACAVMCADGFEHVAVVLGKRGWLRTETSDTPLQCAP